MNFFHPGSKSEQTISNIQIKEKAKIWHKCSESKHYIGMPEIPPLLEGSIYKNGQIFKKQLYVKIYYDKMIFFKNNSGNINSHPYAIVFFELDLKIYWNFRKKEKNKGSEIYVINGLQMIKNNCSIELISDSHEFLQKAKKIISNLIFSLNFYDDYKVIKPIGKGVSAIVYLAQNNENKEMFAVKSCNKTVLYGQKNWKAILFNEIDCLRCFNHENIIKLHGIYETEISYCLIFDLLEGGNLQHHLKKYPKGLNEEDCFHIMKGILTGLNEMHKKQIMHRDIKPENILFRKKFDSIEYTNIVIADLGLATSQNVTKYTYFRCGTPGYIAPEVINITDSNQKYSENCDIFSAGAIFYQIITGNKLFPGEIFDQVVMLNRKAHIDFGALKAKKISEECMDLIKKMLAKESKNRISASDALKHSYFNINKLKINQEEEEFSNNIQKSDGKITINSPSFINMFDFSCKNFGILSQHSSKKDLSDTSDFENITNFQHRETTMNGFIESIGNINEFHGSDPIKSKENDLLVKFAKPGSQRIDQKNFSLI